MQVEMLREIIKRLRKKYSLFNDIYRETIELGDIFSRNDSVSVQIYLQMRQDTLDAIASVNRELELLLNSLPQPERDDVRLWMSGEGAKLPPDALEECRMIAEISHSIKEQGKKVIEADRVINMKMTGEKSIYRTASGAALKAAPDASGR